MQSIYPAFKTDRVLLRAFSALDRENVFKGLSDPRVTKYYGVHLKSPEDTITQMAWFDELEKSKTGIWWAIMSADNSNFYGGVGLYFLKKEHQKVEIGFWLLPEYCGKGLLSEIMPFVLNYGFNEMNIHRIEGFVETENANSAKLLNKMGFVFEGTMKDCEIKNGKYISLDIFAKLNL